MCPQRLTVMLAMLAMAPVTFAQPALSAFSFAPASINTADGPADVTVNFTLSGVANPNYIELVFADPTGAFAARGVKSLPPPGTAPNSMTITFPRFSGAGTWKVLAVFLADASGNTTLLDTAALMSAGFPTNLIVTSAVDNTPPAITSFSFSPTSINTTSAAQNVTMNVTATDNTAIASIYAGFKDPAEQLLRGTRVNAPADFTAAASVTKSFVVNFPKGSPAGVWKISVLNAVDAAGNTLFLDTAAAAGAFPGSQLLTVTSAADSTAPNLSGPLTLAPGTITTAGGPVTVGFSATDDLSGVNYFEVALQSPSGAQSVSAPLNFAANTSHSGSVVVTFPPGVEAGTWTTATVFLADATGNTRTLSVPVSLIVTVPGVDTTPPVVTPTITPSPNSADWNNGTPVTVTWSVTDPESAIASQTGCGTAVLTAGATLTCSATNAVGLSNSAIAIVKIDTIAPITSNVRATPNPIALGADLTISATINDAGGSGVAAAEYRVDNGPFDDLAASDGAFGGASEAVSLFIAGSNPLMVKPGLHTICVRGIDFADNIGATSCVTVAVHGVNTTTGGGGTNSPAGADAANPAGSGPVSYSFNVKYGPGDKVPTGNLEFRYDAGNIHLRENTFDYLVVTDGSRAQIQGAGTINGTNVCKFQIDAYDTSFGPLNTDAFGLKIFDCDGGSAVRYNLPATATTRGKIQVRQ